MFATSFVISGSQTDGAGARAKKSLYTVRITRSGRVAPVAHGDCVGRFQIALLGSAHFSVQLLWADLISQRSVPTAVSKPPSYHWLVWNAPSTSVQVKFPAGGPAPSPPPSEPGGVVSGSPPASTTAAPPLPVTPPDAPPDPAVISPPLPPPPLPPTGAPPLPVAGGPASGVTEGLPEQAVTIRNIAR